MSKTRAPSPLEQCMISKAVKKKEYDEARAHLAIGATTIKTSALFQGILTVAPNVPPGPAGSAPATFDPWLIVQILMKQLDESEVEGIAKKAARRMKDGAPSTEALRSAFNLQAEKLLPRIVIAGSSGAMGAVSFSGTIELE